MDLADLPSLLENQDLDSSIALKIDPNQTENAK